MFYSIFTKGESIMDGLRSWLGFANSLAGGTGSLGAQQGANKKPWVIKVGQMLKLKNLSVSPAALE